ncbi:transposase family protein [Streptomyces sp. LZ34]
MVVTGFKATRARNLTPAEKEANRVLAAGRAPVEHGFAHLKNWRILSKLCTDPPAPPTSCAPYSFRRTSKPTADR